MYGVTFLEFKFGNNGKLPKFLQYAYLSFRFFSHYPETIRLFIENYNESGKTTEYRNYTDSPQLYFFPLNKIWNKTIRIAFMKQRTIRKKEFYCELNKITVYLPPYVDFDKVNKKFKLGSVYELPVVRNFNKVVFTTSSQAKYTSSLIRLTATNFKNYHKILPNSEKIYYSGIALLKSSPGSSGTEAADLPDPNIETGDTKYYLFNTENNILTGITYIKPDGTNYLSALLKNEQPFTFVSGMSVDFPSSCILQNFVIEPVIDEETGNPVIDEETGNPETTVRNVLSGYNSNTITKSPLNIQNFSSDFPIIQNENDTEETYFNLVYKSRGYIVPTKNIVSGILIDRILDLFNTHYFSAPNSLYTWPISGKTALLFGAENFYTSGNTWNLNNSPGIYLNSDYAGIPFVDNPNFNSDLSNVHLIDNNGLVSANYVILSGYSTKLPFINYGRREWYKW